MKAIVHTSGKTVVLVDGMTKEALVAAIKAVEGSLAPSIAAKFLSGATTDAMGWTIQEGTVDEEGKFVQATQETELPQEGAAEGTAEGAATEGSEDKQAAQPDPLLAQLTQNVDPTLAAVEGKLSGMAATKVVRTAASTGQSGQRLKRIERVSGLMAVHTELQPLFDTFTQMGMNVPEKLRNIRETGNTVWFDAAGKGEELMVVKKANGYELRHKTVAGGKVLQGPVFNVASLEEIATHQETIKWLGLAG